MMKLNFKKLAGMTLSALIAAGIGLSAVPEAQAMSHARGHNQSMTKKPRMGHKRMGMKRVGTMNSRMMAMAKCGNVKVTGRMAYLKAEPSMGSRTLRMARMGEPLMVVRNSMGHAHHWNGWVLVKRSNGHRYWAHHSMLGCQ